jgi:hypothetical protein
MADSDSRDLFLRRLAEAVGGKRHAGTQADMGRARLWPRRTAWPVVLTRSFSIQPSNFGLTTPMRRSSVATVPIARTVCAMLDMG